MDIELPECPVCLLSYDGEYTIPRVLACGHTACETCLVNLPQKYPNAIRCPACNVIVKFPPQGPPSLPKNIDLLRLIPSSSKANPQIPDKPFTNYQQVNFVPRLWSDELYSAWKDWVLPEDAVSLVSKSKEGDELCGGLLRETTKVSLVRVGSLSCDDDSVFKFSYVERIMNCLSRMKKEETDELSFICRVCSKQNRVCKTLGLWGNLEDGYLHLVCEGLNGCLLNELRDLGEDGIFTFSIIAMEICEAMISLHKEGLIVGCLSISCFKFDDLGHLYIDLNEILEMERRICRLVGEAGSGEGTGHGEMDLILTDLLTNEIFVSPEVLLELLQRQGIKVEGGGLKYSVGYSSDVWSLSCVLLRILVGKEFTNELVEYLPCKNVEISNESFLNVVWSNTGWMGKICSSLDYKFGRKLESVQQSLFKCLNLVPGSRPPLPDIWKCIRELIIKPQFDGMVSLNSTIWKESTSHCLFLGELSLYWQCKERAERPGGHEWEGTEDDGETDFNQTGKDRMDKHLVNGLSDGTVKYKDLRGHLDCITGLAVGGNFLFSSSFDKSINLWSLQDFSHLHTFRGHEHKVMAVAYVDGEEPLCVSGDSEGGIYLWNASIPFGQEPLRKWYEPKDWRYSGIHSLTTSGNRYIYTGSGDKTIKAWSLQDGTLQCTMSGHKSVVSTLLVKDGVLYSGSWDGTIRLWSLGDHSLLTVLGEDAQGTVTSVLSVSADHHYLVAAHENGSLKVWMNDVLMKCIQTHSGAVFATDMDGKWLFTGGWDKTINVQELKGDEFQLEATPIGSISCGSVITTLLYVQGKLFVGCADRTVKVYYYGK